MKRNVDLSESRIFTTSEPLTGLTKIVHDFFMSIKPWDFENKPREIVSDFDSEINSERRRVFAIGNKRERQIWKRNYAYDTGQICDFCGQSSGKKPWARKRCNCYSMSYTRKIPWKF